MLHTELAKSHAAIIADCPPNLEGIRRNLVRIAVNALTRAHESESNDALAIKYYLDAEALYATL
jgi:hypothetical protein